MELAQVLLHARERFPNGTAIHQGGHHLSYEQVFADVERIAGRLVEAGVGPGEVVALDIRRPVSHWLILLALMRVGAVSVSLSDRGEAELAALPEASTVISARDETRAYPARLRQLRVDADWLRLPADAARPPEVATAEGSLGRICFTSGTSGRPKAILLTAPMLRARLANTARRSRIHIRSVLWCGLGADTAYGFTATLAAWLEGAAVVLSRGGEGDFPYFLARQVNLLIASPAAASALARAAAAVEAPRLQATVIIAGGRLTPALRDALRSRLAREVLVAYGSSEAGGVTLGRAEGLDAHPGHVGAIFADVEAQAVDAAGAALPPDTVGRLRVRSKSCATAYLNAPEASARHFRDGWFEPGDMAKISPDGILTLFGRPADTLNLGGVKLSVDEIDALVREEAGIEDACAVTLSDQGLAIAILGRPANAAALAARLRAALPLPPRFQLIAAARLPRGSMGKLDRAALAEAIEAALKAAPGEAAAGDFRLICIC